MSWVGGDAGENVGQPSLWIDAIHLGRLCRPPNYAERFWMRPIVCKRCEDHTLVRLWAGLEYAYDEDRLIAACARAG
jgi:hypothetical protein